MQSPSQIVIADKPTPNYLQTQCDALPVAQPTVSKHCGLDKYVNYISVTAAIGLRHCDVNDFDNQSNGRRIDFEVES